MKSHGSNKRDSDNISKGNLINPSHHPMPGADDEPIDAGASSGTQLPRRTTEKESGKLQKKNDNGSQPKGFDPDDVMT
ncbi:hypothetical protein Q8A64_04095 [Oxalobacteraceae bacterium R-40]|uniref:Uncharacterized protein n=1 Tax=Keguizhuia sedimenti TaxID=3064264 RepID=A0ABU1BKT0_9BURK|nr:hypothetical protein [Oxalobacteraceae bacterium R-40]